MGNARSPNTSHREREQRAQQTAVMKGYARALSSAYHTEPLPPRLQKLLDALDQAEKR